MNFILKMINFVVVVFNLRNLVTTCASLLRVHPRFSPKWVLTLIIVMIALPVIFVAAAIGQQEFMRRVDEAFPPKYK